MPAIAWPVVGAGAVLLKTATAARRAIGENLERAGYAVRAAGSAAEARRLVETEEPALAIVDLILPDGDGISLLGELRGAWPAMPGLIVTSYVELRSIVEAMRQGPFAGTLSRHGPSGR